MRECVSVWRAGSGSESGSGIEQQRARSRERRMSVVRVCVLFCSVGLRYRSTVTYFFAFSQ